MKDDTLKMPFKFLKGPNKKEYESSYMEDFTLVPAPLLDESIDFVKLWSTVPSTVIEEMTMKQLEDAALALVRMYRNNVDYLIYVAMSNAFHETCKSTNSAPRPWSLDGMIKTVKSEIFDKKYESYCQLANLFSRIREKLSIGYIDADIAIIKTLSSDFCSRVRNVLIEDSQQDISFVAAFEIFFRENFIDLVESYIIAAIPEYKNAVNFGMSEELLAEYYELLPVATLKLGCCNCD